jgi:hypothetical protein
MNRSTRLLELRTSPEGENFIFKLFEEVFLSLLFFFFLASPIVCWNMFNIDCVQDQKIS